MISFAPLRQFKQKDGKIDKEQQEQKDFSEYQQFIEFQRKGDTQNAQKILESLISSSLWLKGELGQLGRRGIALKFACLKNLGVIFQKKSNFELAMQYFGQALELDSSDLLTCFHLSECALALGDLSIAQLALEKCKSINPQYLIAQDRLVDVLYWQQHFPECVQQIEEISKFEPHYFKGTIIKKSLTSKRSDLDEIESQLLQDLDENTPKRLKPNPPPPPKDIKRSHMDLYSATWYSLGALLVKEISKPTTTTTTTTSTFTTTSNNAEIESGMIKLCNYPVSIGYKSLYSVTSSPEASKIDFFDKEGLDLSQEKDSQLLPDLSTHNNPSDSQHTKNHHFHLHQKQHQQYFTGSGSGGSSTTIGGNSENEISDRDKKEFAKKMETIAKSKGKRSGKKFQVETHKQLAHWYLELCTQIQSKTISGSGDGEGG